MKRIYLAKTQQHGVVFYTGSVDPRILVRMADQSIEVGQVQEDQRPLDKKHIQEIAAHVGENQGLLPTSIIVGTKVKDKLTVNEEKSTSGDDLHYMLIPETDQELKEYENTIDISDGQHRIFAFSDSYRSQELKNSEVYEVPVTFFITPPLKTRQSLFYTTNAKQKPVPANLLLWLRDKLQLLSKQEETYLPLVRLLNSENMSPLKGRIIISAEQISKGYKAKELVKILNKAKIAETGVATFQQIDDDKMAQILSVYLSSWEHHYQLDFQHPKQDTMTKISGLRYILLLFSYFIEIAVNTKTKFDESFVRNSITELEEAKGLDPINGESLFTKDALDFRGEGATVKRAENDGNLLKAYVANKQTSGFNPFE